MANIILGAANRERLNAHHEALERAGHTVKTCLRGRRVTGLLRKFPTDLIVLASKMGGENGFQLAREIHTSEEAAGVPIVMLLPEGADADEYIKEQLWSGASVSVPEPVDWQQFLASEEGAFLQRFLLMQRAGNPPKRSDATEDGEPGERSVMARLNASLGNEPFKKLFLALVVLVFGGRLLVLGALNVLGSAGEYVSPPVGVRARCTRCEKTCDVMTEDLDTEHCEECGGPLGRDMRCQDCGHEFAWVPPLVPETPDGAGDADADTAEDKAVAFAEKTFPMCPKCGSPRVQPVPSESEKAWMAKLKGSGD